jgi:hypothetical protein
MAVFAELEECAGTFSEQFVPGGAVRIVAACAAQRFFLSVNGDQFFTLQRMPLRTDTCGMGLSSYPGMACKTSGINGHHEQPFAVSSVGLMTNHTHAGLYRGMTDLCYEFLFKVAFVAQIRDL